MKFTEFITENRNDGRWRNGRWIDNTSTLQLDKRRGGKMKLKDRTQEEFNDKHKDMTKTEHEAEAIRLDQEAQEHIKKEEWGSSSGKAVLARMHTTAARLK